MEFSLEVARQLHRSLPAMDFEASPADDPLLNAYSVHYGLDQFDSHWKISHSIGVFDSLQYQLVCQYFALPKEHSHGIVVLVHGYYDHVGLYRHAIQCCLTQGFSVLAFDLPGHGLSSGEPASIDSFDHYSRGLCDCIGLAEAGSLAGPWYLLAQSTGAAAVINCLLNQDRFSLPVPEKTVLLAPLLRPLGWTNGLFKLWIMRRFVTQTKRDFAGNSHDDEFLRFIAEQDPLQARYLKVDWVLSLKAYLENFESAADCDVPLHIVQGTEDTTVDWRYNLPRLKEKFPASNTHLIEGARHHLVNESEVYRAKIFAVVKELLG